MDVDVAIVWRIGRPVPGIRLVSGHLEDIVAVRIIGELDCANAVEAFDAVRELIAAASATIVELDSLSFIDASGLRQLDMLQRTDRNVRVVAAQPTPAGRLLAMPEIWTNQVFATFDEAMADAQSTR